MKRLDIGSAYTAHCFVDGVRQTGQGYYHFKMLEKSYFFYNGKKHSITLGLKIGVSYNPYEDCSQCFWFDQDGVSDSNGVRFEIKRKIKKGDL